MAKEKFIVTGDDRDVINRRFEDIMRQLRLKNGSPLDPELVKIALQRIGEGNFAGISKKPIHDFSEVIYRHEIGDDYESFRVDLTFTKENQNVKFSSIDPKFIKLFGEKVEAGNIFEEVPYNYNFIYFRDLLLVNPVQTIFRELGSGSAIFKLRNIYRMLENSFNEGYLVNGKKSYFFALDVNKELQLLCFWWDIWRENGWAIEVVCDFESNKKVLPPAQFLSFRS